MRHSRRLGFAAAAVLLLAGGIVAWVELRYEIFPKRWVEVEPGALYRSGQLSERLVEDVLARHGIQVVVDLDVDEPGEPGPDAEARAAEALGIEHLLFPLRGDGTGDVESYAAAIAAIEAARQQGKPVLVHCAAGARRTGGVIAAYQVLVRGVAPSQAYQELDRFGRTPVAETPLVAWLDGHVAQLAASLHERGVIERIPDPVPRFGPSP